MLTLLLAMMSGVRLVNVYYGYHQIWGEPSADLTNSYSHFTTPHSRGTARPRPATARSSS